MNNKKIVFSVLILMASLIISQCILPARESVDYLVHVNQPRDGAVVSVGESVTVWGQVIDWLDIDTARITRMRFLANGLIIGEASSSFGPSRYTEAANVEWIPDAPGEYYLQVIGSRRGHLAISRAVKVCVIDFSLASPDLGEIGIYDGAVGYEGECEIPERSAEARPGELTFSTVASPDSLTYFPGTWHPELSEFERTTEEPPDICRNVPAPITFEASAGDPNDDIAFVKVDVSYDYNRFIFSSSLILNRVAGSALDAKVFTGVSTSPRDFVADELNQTFEVRWTAYAIGRTGEILAQEGPNIIPVDPCILEVMLPLTAPLPTEAPVFIPSEENCPPGTYFAPVTNRCIEIQIPNRDGDSEGGGGSCNLSSSACGSQGLSFDSNSCECVPIQ